MERYNALLEQLKQVTTLIKKASICPYHLEKYSGELIEAMEQELIDWHKLNARPKITNKIRQDTEGMFPNG